MSGFFGVASQNDCICDLFFGTDYHSHLGTRRGGLVVRNGQHYLRYIHDITNTQFRSKFEHDIGTMKGNVGLGVISDYEDQPLIIGSHLGTYSLVTVGSIQNLEQLSRKMFSKRAGHFSEMSGGAINPTELVATLINQADSFAAGIENAQEAIEGSCSIMLLTDDGIYAARDKCGRTPVVIGAKEGAYAATLETAAFLNLDYEVKRFLGPGEIVKLTPDGVTEIKAPGVNMKICAFLWIYYGYPASSYENINVEVVRNRCGMALARHDTVVPDIVAGIPDSGTGHAVGYANAAGIPYRRPFVKYTPTWPRSFMPQDQYMRNLVARMKLLPIKALIEGLNLLFCEDSIVRGTQLQDTIKRIYEAGAGQIHMRAACPPLLFGCRYLNFSRSRSELDLAARRAVKQLEGRDDANLQEYADSSSDRHAAMVEKIRARLNLTTLVYQKLDDMILAIGLPEDKICTYCWTGKCC